MECLIPRSCHASSFPHGYQLLGLQTSEQTINQAPGLDLATQSRPVDRTKGVVMKASTTAEPERPCIFTFHPFLSFFQCRVQSHEKSWTKGDSMSLVEMPCMFKGNLEDGISHTQGKDNALRPNFAPFKDVPGTLNPSDPIESLMMA
ncbi:hypothetical protein FXO37_26510 [Capsicum annuum]|nr:hypothetical protein FXO37_26510 [Capsicum annuum]